MNIELVDNARAWWKMYSVHVFLFIEAIGVWQVIAPFVSWALPNWLLGVMVMLVAAAGIAARLIKQFNLAPADVGLTVVGPAERSDQ
ncbi:hypothetical protein LJR084_001937 [Variovorax sp. LjRoot84]|uniref:DUF7940 domain-containing protein n=1 Tax=Variovorax sp. LjRoot84 TaxID=3342340 RepID=UPI003ECDA2AA